MEDGTILIKLDIREEPFIVDACKTDYGKTSLSTWEYMIEEINNCSNEDLLSPIDKAGIYKVTSVYDDYPDFTYLGE